MCLARLQNIGTVRAGCIEYLTFTAKNLIQSQIMASLDAVRKAITVKNELELPISLIFMFTVITVL